MASNLSYFSIPAYWAIALFPHAYSVSLIKKSNNNQWNNKNPRGNAASASYQSSVPAEVFARYERARAAHNHAMENAPYFIGAVLVGNYAGLSPSTMNTVTGACLALRIVHSLLYINVTKQKTSYLRTLTFAALVTLIMGTCIAAANKLR